MKAGNTRYTHLRSGCEFVTRVQQWAAAEQPSAALEASLIESGVHPGALFPTAEAVKEWAKKNDAWPCEIARVTVLGIEESGVTIRYTDIVTNAAPAPLPRWAYGY